MSVHRVRDQREVVRRNRDQAAAEQDAPTAAARAGQLEAIKQRFDRCGLGAFFIINLVPPRVGRPFARRHMLRRLIDDAADRNERMHRRAGAHPLTRRVIDEAVAALQPRQWRALAVAELGETALDAGRDVIGARHAYPVFRHSGG